MRTNREIVRQQFLNWCAPPGPGKAYYRPLVCRGNVEDVSLFLVTGLPVAAIPQPFQTNGNPAPGEAYERQLAQFPLADFAERLTNYERYREMVEAVSSGKDEHAAVRERIDALCAPGFLPLTAAETAINAYPAKDGAALKTEDRKTVERGYDIFFNGLQLFRPAWILLFGKSALDDASAFFSTRFGTADFRGKWKEINVREPLPVPLTFIKLGGVKCRIAATRSLDKRPVKGIPDSDYSDARFEKFCGDLRALFAESGKSAPKP